MNDNKIRNLSLGVVSLVCCFTVAVVCGATGNASVSTESKTSSGFSSQTSSSSSSTSTDSSSSVSLGASSDVSSQVIDQAASAASSSSAETNAVSIVPYAQIEDLFADDVKSVLTPIAEKSWDKLATVIESLDKFINFSQDHLAISEDRKILASLILLTEAQQEELFEDASVSDAVKGLIDQLSLQLESFEKAKYSDDVYNKLTDSSEEFSKIGKRTELVVPRQLIIAGQSFVLKNAPIKYDGHILISLDDALQYINAGVQSDDKRFTIALQTSKILLEFSRGSSVAYVNDKTSNMEVPSLYFKNKVYIPAEFFAKTYGISYKFISDTGLLVFYGGASLN